MKFPAKIKNVDYCDGCKDKIESYIAIYDNSEFTAQYMITTKLPIVREYRISMIVRHDPTALFSKGEFGLVGYKPTSSLINRVYNHLRIHLDAVIEAERKQNESR